MSHPIQQQIAAVTHRARRALAVRGASAWVALVVAAVMILGLGDYLVRFEDPGIRVMASLALLAAIVGGAYRYLRGAVAPRLGELSVAQRIERCYPELKQSLSSAIVFLRQEEDEAGAGSGQLRRAAIAEATSRLEVLDLGQVVDFRHARRAFALAACILAAAIGLLVISPEGARIALARLANPFGATSWPRENELAFQRPLTRLAAGQMFEVELIDRHGNLPDEVTMHIRYATEDGWSDDETEAMQFISGTMRFRRESVSRPFQYRASGGDDETMAWIDLEVVESPRVETFRAQVYPPAYSGLPSVAAERQIRALAGSRIAFQGTATKPLSRAQLRLENGTAIPARLSEDGLEFSIAAKQFLVSESGDYWFELHDAEGLSDRQPERYSLEAVPDSPPSVVFQKPLASNHFTAKGVVPLEILVKDDLLIRDVRVLYTRSDRSDEGEFSQVLYEGPRSVVVDKEATDLGDGESRTVRHAWQLASLELPPGTQLSLSATSSDYLPQTGQAASPRRITIITPAELEDRLAARQRLILAELARALEMEKTTRGQLATLLIQAQEVGRFERGDIDHLHAAELNQRQLQRTLTDKQEGVPQYIESLLEDLDNNRVDNPEIRRRMEGILSEIQRLKGEELARIESQLTTALKTAQAVATQTATDTSDDTKPTAPRAALEAAAADQDQVIAALSTLLGDLTQWTDYRRLAREVRLIREGQDRLIETTRRVGTGALGEEGTLRKSVQDLSPQESANLKKASSEQHELARGLEKLLQTMEEMSDQLAEENPLAAATLQDAASAARGKNAAGELSGQMRRAAELVKRNEIGQAINDQKQAAEKLDELLDILANKREAELARLVEKLREAEQELTGLRAEQRGLRKKLEEAAATTDPQERKRQLERLQRRQREVAEQIEQLARRLQRLQAKRAGNSAQDAAQKLGAACEACQGGNGDQAAEQARGAEKDLDDAAEALAETRRRAEADLANEQMAQFEDALAGMIQLQQRLLDDTADIHGRRDSAAQDRELLASIEDISRAQLSLRDQVVQQARKMDQHAVFQLALNGGAEAMALAGELLARRQTGDEAQSRQRDALQRLQQLKQAMADDENQAEQQDEGEAGAGEGGGGKGGEGGIQDIAQLKLVKLMQEHLNLRFRHLQELRRTGTAAADALQDDELRLADEQGQLADLVLDLVVAEDTAASDDPDQLPELDLNLDDQEGSLELPPLELELNDAN